MLKMPFFQLYPGRGGQTEVTPDQTSFERTHVPGALELHGLEKASSALLSGQWSGTCLIRGHFVLGRSDQRQFQAHTSLIRGRFERTLVWPETNSSAIFFNFFLFSYWLWLSRVRDNNKTAFWSELHLRIWWVWSEPGVQLITNSGPLKKRFWIKVDQDVFMQSCLSSFFQLKE